MLNQRQLTRLSDHTIRFHRATDVASLGRAASEALRELISCDWPLVSLGTTYFPNVRHSFSPAREDWSGYADRVLTLAHEDPVYTGRLRLLLDRPASPTEFVGRSELERTAVYNDVWKPIGAKSILRYLSPGRYGYRLEVGRESAREFGPDDVAIMHLVARHVDAATDDLVRRHGMMAPLGSTAVPVQMFSWLVCDRQGRVLRTMEHAVRLMRACVGREAPMDVIPSEWRAELERRVAGHPASPFWYSCDGCPVSVHIAPIRPTTDEFSVGFLERPAPGDPVETLIKLGLTRREAEVLRWVAEGKSNAEVGVILGISALTVKKHLENIFGKLGVENRTMAVVIALESMKPGPAKN